MTTCNYCDLPRENNDHVCQCPEINQCDGCRRNLLLDHKGIHRDEHGWPVMGCTADRYKPSSPQDGVKIP